jgi:hypothetical protein
MSLPSKIFNLQSVSVPILGISPDDSELARHLDLYKNGKCFSQSEPDQITDFIKEMKNNTQSLRLMAENSGEAALLFTSRNAKKYYDLY